MNRLLLHAVIALLPLAGRAQIAFTGAPYTQNFNALQSTPNNTAGVTWADNTTLPGWYASQTSYGVTDATMGGGADVFDSTSVAANVGLFSFGAAGSADRALGSRANTALGQVTHGVRLRNMTGALVTGFTVSFTGEQWFKSSVETVHSLGVDFSTDATTLATGTWIALGAASFSAPTTAGTTPAALDGNAAANRRSLVAAVTGIAWAPGADLWIRFTDVNESGSEQGLAVDDFQLATTPFITLDSPAGGEVFIVGDAIELAATAGDADGTVAKVAFFQGDTLLHEDTSAPYTFTWTGFAAGVFSLTARVTDDAGHVVSSVPAAITINASAGSGTLTRGPYLNQANQDSIVIRWRGSQPVKGRVRYGTSSDSLTQSVTETAPTAEHSVRLTGLAPHTRYYYSIGSAVDTLAGGDADHTFRTSPVPGAAEDARIWVLGDAGRASSGQAAVRDAYQAWTGARTPDLCLMLGDNAYYSGTDAEYQAAVFDMYPAILRKMPLWSCLGNHDADGGSTSGTANFPYFDIFTLPAAGECGGAPSGTERYYSFDHGHIHFIVLDSQTSSRDTIESTGADGAMAAWLRADLAGVTATWLIALFHHPAYSKGSHDSDSETQLVEMRSRFGPILEAGGVDLVLNGHSHSYERTFLLDGHYGASGTFTAAHKKQSGDGRPAGGGAYIKPLTGPRDHFGAVYTLTGSAGSADGGSLDHPAMFVSCNTLGSFNLDISGNRLDATYIQGDGAAADTFTLIKQGAADHDGDGVADAFELAHGMDRFDPADATTDTDGDGNTARAEYLFGLNPAASDRYGWTTTRDPATGHVLITYPTLTQRVYRVYYSHDLLEWHPATAPVSGDGTIKTWTDDGSITGSPPDGVHRRFYRVQAANGP